MTAKSSVTLSETATSGTFSGEVELYDATFKGELGDIFTANYTTSGSTITTQAIIQDDNVFLDFLTAGNATGAFTHDMGDVVGLIYNATINANTGVVDTIDVTITSDANAIGTTITLTETGINTGLFIATRCITR